MEEELAMFHIFLKGVQGVNFMIYEFCLLKIVQGPVGGNDRNMAWLIYFI